MKRVENLLLPLLTAAIILVAWHYGVKLTKTKIFPTPFEVVQGLRQLVHRGVLWSYIRDSLFRVSVGYLLAAVLGVPFGILISWYPKLGRAFNPLIQLLRPISPLAWMPLAIIWFGVSNVAPIFLIFLGAFFPIVVATMNGVRNVPAMYVQAGRNFGLSSWDMMRRVVLPAILPRVLTGLRIALGIAWLVVVAAEMIAVDSGLGYLIIDSRNAGKRYDLVIAGMLLIGLIGLGLDILLRRAERLQSVRWGFNQ
ncbi:MAG TPA: ABC transporter permease [Thermoanaerobaculia bacterium]|nr:ABC transporter permease [Thermoanaerobaculia bacterium]